MNSRDIRFHGMSGSVSPSSYDTGSNNSSIDDSYSDVVSSNAVKPSRSSRTSNNSRFKTELCRSFEEQGRCKYGSKCQFAHGLGELREITRHPRYKTELCKRFHATGFCSYGTRCHFVHDLPASVSDSSSMDAKNDARVEAFATQHPRVSSSTGLDEDRPRVVSTPWHSTCAYDPPPGFGKMAGSFDGRDLRLEASVGTAGIGRLARQSFYDRQFQVEARIRQLLLSLGGTQLPLLAMDGGY